MATVEMPIAEGCLGDELRSSETVKTQCNNEWAIYYLSTVLLVYSFGTASPSFGPGMTVMLLVPGPTLTACDAFGAKVFLATRTLRSLTLPMNIW